MSHDKDIILFINSMHAPTHSALRTYEQRTGQHFTPLVIVDVNIQESIQTLNDQGHLSGQVEVVIADFDSAASIRQALKPYENRIIGITSQYENSIHEFKKIIPYVPYLHTPTESSLEWATDKKLMRTAFDAYDLTLSPGSLHVEDVSSDTIAAIENKLSYPVIIKPSGLERSLLVSIAHDRQELTHQLTNTFKELHEAYQTWMKRLEPAVLVEEFMIGDMYSIDSYIAPDGTVRHAPMVKVVTGHDVGFDDFFMYLLLTSTGLSEDETGAAQHAAEKAYRALGLRSMTTHTELMKTPKGWRIIEVGPRIGGYRHELYSLSYGLNHIMNDVINRVGLMPEISSTPLRHSAVFSTYPHEEGVLKKIHGLNEIKRLPSFVTMKQVYKEGDMLRFAHHNGDPTVEITLCNQENAQLEADIKAIEQLLDIEVSATTEVSAMAVGAVEEKS